MSLVSAGQAEQLATLGKKKMSKRVMMEAERGGSEMRVRAGKEKGKFGKKMMKMDGNTIDCRGMESDDAMTECRGFFSRMIGSGRGCVYVLHGHGSGGVLKKKLRESLRREVLVEKFSPADDEDGGDAYTMCFLKESLL